MSAGPPEDDTGLPPRRCSVTGSARLRVRRLPDIRGLMRPRGQYEVACFAAGSDVPLWVRQTANPGSVLRSEGVHSTDVHDYVDQADQAWDGGTGPWRSAFPSENP